MIRSEGVVVVEHQAGIEELAAVGRTRRFRKGERLVLEGFVAGAVTYLHSGSVRIVASTPEGDEVTLAVRSAGDLIGDHSALLGERTDAGVVALADGEATVVASDRYLEVLARHPDLLLEQARHLVLRLREADERLVELSTLSVGERVVRQLLRFDTDCDGRIVVPLSQQELAAMCGTSRGVVAEVLGELRRGGMIETGRRHITVLDAEALSSAAS